MKCQNCGAETKGEVCEYCGSEITVATVNSDNVKGTDPTTALNKTKTCPKCKKQVKIDAKACPHCGYKFLSTSGCLLILIIVFVLIYIIVSVAKGSVPFFSSKDIVNSVSITVKDDSKGTYNDATKTLYLSEINISIENVKQASKNQLGNSPAKGNIYIAIYLKIDNVSNENQYISFYDFDAYCSGIQCKTNSAAFESIGGDISPQKSTLGWFTFEAPKNWTELEIQVKFPSDSVEKHTIIITK